MNSKSFLEGAPKYLTKRFQSVNKYVWDVLFPELERRELFSKIKNKRLRKLEFERRKAIIDEAAIISFIYLINQFFIEGSRAAQNAVDTFKELEVNGFYIGNKLFQGRNENVEMGMILSNAMLASIESNKVKAVITTSKSLFQILDKYNKLIKNKK